MELEKDLSLKQQFLDVVIIEKKGGKMPDVLPDGMADLAAHNLMTFKSHRESLDGWALAELCGHYVNYRKQISPSPDNLLPAGDFRLFAVSARFPESLARRIKFSESGTDGVCDVKWGTLDIRVVVTGRVERSERNALWMMFSADPGKVRFGAESYKWKTPVSTVMNRLFEKYQAEGVAVMPYTMEDFQREVKEEVMNSLTGEDIDNLLKKLAPEDRLKGLRPEDRLKGLRPEDRLKGLRPEEIKAYLKKIRREGHS